ncbi:hypothetical protein HHI36_001819 [Cryptolaemus montrouzieri]|uniref:Uncharacterized protein n=1 Tax=Cryptolaemus montrouzieri TaxID=559131 RepID=A0ABD2PA30_9CUCU
MQIASAADNPDSIQDQNLLPLLPIDSAGETQKQIEAAESSLKPSTSSCKPYNSSDSSVAIGVTKDTHNTLTGYSDISQPSTSSFPTTNSLAVPVMVIYILSSGNLVRAQDERKSKKRTMTFLLTSSPKMAELKLKRETEAKKRKRRQAVNRSLYMNDDSDEDGLDQDGEEDDCACIYCNDLYSGSKPGEG